METESEEMSPVSRFVERVRARVTEGHTMRDAVRHVLTTYPTLCTSVLDYVGMWPSSEREIRLLQELS